MAAARYNTARFGPSAIERGLVCAKKANKALLDQLIRWYRAYQRALPWRQTRDPYRIWISEVMLQQTTVSSVIPYYDNWLRLFPDMPALARASREKILKAWEGLGYYERARNLHQAARIMCRENDCRVPDKYEDLIALPGFGPYIAAAVLSIAYDRPCPVLDANVRRVGMRLAGIHGPLSPRLDRTLLERLRVIFPKRNGGEFNQAMMELGALVCRPRNPSCLLCPLQRFCLAFERGEQEIIPAPKKRSFQKIETVVGIIRDGHRYLIQRRPIHGLLAGLWEFPGGKREKGETLRNALHREIQEELAAEVRIGRQLLKVHHSYTRFRVTLFAFECELSGLPKLRRGSHRWVSLRAMKRYPFPSGSARVIRFLEDTEGHGKADRRVS
jgi:A/G-specific adenine glycosylase